MIVLMHGEAEAEKKAAQVKTLNKYILMYLDKQQKALDEEISREACSRWVLSHVILETCSGYVLSHVTLAICSG